MQGLGKQLSPPATLLHVTRPHVTCSQLTIHHTTYTSATLLIVAMKWSEPGPKTNRINSWLNKPEWQHVSTASESLLSPPTSDYPPDWWRFTQRIVACSASAPCLCSAAPAAPSPLRGAGPDPPLFKRCSVIVGLELELSTKFRESFHIIFRKYSLIIDGQTYGYLITKLPISDELWSRGFRQ